MVFDPLDPAAAGYTERFNRLPVSASAAGPAVSHSHMMIEHMVSARAQVGDAVGEVEEEGGDEDEVEDGSSSGEEDDDEEEGAESAEAVAPVVAAPAPAISMEFDIEALMKRRMMMQEEAVVEVERPLITPAPSVDVPEESAAEAKGGLMSLLGAYGSDSEDEDAEAKEQGVMAKEQEVVEDAAAVDEEEEEAQEVAPLKSISADPALVSLIPAALRRKRAAPSATLSVLKKIKAHNVDALSQTMPSALVQPHSRSIASTAATFEVATSALLDDEYASFMQEIKSLGSS